MPDAPAPDPALIAARLAAVRDQIRDAALACGRDPASVRLIAVSKTRPAEEVRAAMAAGQVDFGENYAQELRDKADAFLAGGAPIRWHFIGALQRNKVKYVVGRAELIHDVDNVALAEEISRRAGHRPVDILLGVNVGRDPRKSGWMPEQIPAVLPIIAALPGVRLRGLMCVPPPIDYPEQLDATYATLAQLAAEGVRAGFPLTELSMGMSQDYPTAIRHGATLVRVGTAIFGGRAPKNG